MAQECFVCGAHAMIPLKTHSWNTDPKYYVYCTACECTRPIDQHEYNQRGEECARLVLLPKVIIPKGLNSEQQLICRDMLQSFDNKINSVVQEFFDKIQSKKSDLIDTIASAQDEETKQVFNHPEVEDVKPSEIVKFFQSCIAKGYDLDSYDISMAIAGNFDTVIKAHTVIPDGETKQVLKDAGLEDIETSPGAGKSCGMPPDDKPVKDQGWTVEDDHPTPTTGRISAFVDQPKGGSLEVQEIPMSLGGLADGAIDEWYKRFAQLVKDGVYMDSRNEIKVQLITNLIEEIKKEYPPGKGKTVIGTTVYSHGKKAELDALIRKTTGEKRFDEPHQKSRIGSFINDDGIMVYENLNGPTSNLTKIRSMFPNNAPMDENEKYLFTKDFDAVINVKIKNYEEVYGGHQMLIGKPPQMTLAKNNEKFVYVSVFNEDDRYISTEKMVGWQRVVPLFNTNFETSVIFAKDCKMDEKTKESFKVDFHAEVNALGRGNRTIWNMSSIIIGLVQKTFIKKKNENSERIKVYVVNQDDEQCGHVKIKDWQEA